MIDIHLHTRFSFDSEELPENYLKRAEELGVPAVGFSEHYDYDAFLDGAGIALCDLSRYVGYVRGLQARRKTPQVLCGAELGYSARACDHYIRLVREYPFDYVINSVHTLPDRGDSYYPKFFEGRTVRQSYLDYFNAVLASVKAPYDYQIVGHIGYVSRYCRQEGGRIRYGDYREIFDEIIGEIVKRDKCLEINTSVGGAGGDFLPDRDVLSAYLKAGGTKLSFGSDAHRAEDYCRKADSVLSFLKAEGVNVLCYYKDRKCVLYNI